MDKAINGNGWAFRPADGDKPASWAGNDSVFNQKSVGANNKGIAAGGSAAIAVIFGGLFLAAGSPLAALVLVGICAFIVWYAYKGQPQFVGSAWQLAASGNGLTYRGGSSWSVGFDEINRIESGATVEWQRMRDNREIPDAEIQVFIFCYDGRRLVVHTANAAREDCGRLAHSIRAYVETQRGGAAPAPETSSPAADGFDL